jgi:hypothetical protein
MSSKEMLYKNKAVFKFTSHSSLGSRLQGIAHIHDDAFNQGFLFAYDSEKCKFQRGHKNSDCAKELVNTFLRYSEKMDLAEEENDAVKKENLITAAEDELPQGRLLLAVPPQFKTLDDAEYLLIVDGGHRVRCQLKAGINQSVPYSVEIYEGKTEAELANIFVNANTQTNMSQSDLISAALVSGALKDIYNRFQESYDNGSLKYELCVHNQDWKDYSKNDKKQKELFSSLVKALTYGVFGDSSTSGILRKSNHISQDAVDSFCKVYSKFVSIIGRKSIEIPSRHDHQYLSCDNWKATLARLAVNLKVSDTRMENTLTLEDYENFFRNLVQASGPARDLRLRVFDYRASGATGKKAIWDYIVNGGDSRSEKGGIDISEQGMKVNLVHPDSDFPYKWRIEMLANPSLYKERGKAQRKA